MFMINNPKIKLIKNILIYNNSNIKIFAVNIKINKQINE